MHSFFVWASASGGVCDASVAPPGFPYTWYGIVCAMHVGKGAYLIQINAFVFCLGLRLSLGRCLWCQCGSPWFPIHLIWNSVCYACWKRGKLNTNQCIRFLFGPQPREVSVMPVWLPLVSHTLDMDVLCCCQGEEVGDNRWHDDEDIQVGAM